MSGYEIEPLAYRVRPLPEECFGSWLQRLSVRHDATLRQLFAHLGIPQPWAMRDLTAWGALGLAQRMLLVERLSFATGTKVARVERTFVKCRTLHLLPPALRAYGCPQCWLEWLEAGEPWRIERRWILRVSLMCKRHRLVLTKLREINLLGRTAVAKIKLQERILATRALMERMDFMPSRLLANSAIGHDQIKGIDAIVPRSNRFLNALIGNRFHLSSARPVLLAGLHTRTRAASAQFAEMFAFDAAPVRISTGRVRSDEPSVLRDLVAARCAPILRNLDQDGAKLAVLGERLASAWRAYPVVFTVEEQRRRRGMLQRTLREGYAAELAASGAAPVSALRGLQDALFYLKQCGMADDTVFFDPAAPDPWDDVLGDQQRLRARLAERFAHPLFARILGRPPQLSTLERFNRSRS
ncbi:TniQ family protein [Leptolyngbya sp. AN03gr2]|uniref:TniQ family protein n=1 Tax=Leptolyngbya sp. AN03gr2 TaxID=3423364 RepID=UPI003D317614